MSTFKIYYRFFKYFLFENVSNLIKLYLPSYILHSFPILLLLHSHDIAQTPIFSRISRCLANGQPGGVREQFLYMSKMRS